MLNLTNMDTELVYTIAAGVILAQLIGMLLPFAIAVIGSAIGFIIGLFSQKDEI